MQAVRLLVVAVRVEALAPPVRWQHPLKAQALRKGLGRALLPGQWLLLPLEREGDHWAPNRLLVRQLLVEATVSVVRQTWSRQEILRPQLRATRCSSSFCRTIWPRKMQGARVVLRRRGKRQGRKEQGGMARSVGSRNSLG